METKKILLVLIVIFSISQIIIISLIFFKTEQSLKEISALEARVNEKIGLSEKATQNKINFLTDSVISLTESVNVLSSTQTSLQEQLSEVKASTSADFSDIIEQEVRGVVTIKTDVSQGTGFLITDDGFLITNAHVLSGASYANIHTYNNRVYTGELVGYDLDMDIVVLKIKGNFFSLDFGDSDDVKIGEKVIAIGNPLGLSFTVTEGIISAKNRIGVNNLPYYFQTDVSLNPGNSGGPLINTGGDVIGINNFKISGADNIGFALEINHAVETINEITMENLDKEII